MKTATLHAHVRTLALAPVLALALGACTHPPQPTLAAVNAPVHVDTAGSPARTQPAATTTALPLLVVSKNPSCGCCGLWVEHMRQSGFQVQVHEIDNLDPIKTRLGVPAGKGSCHTAEVGGYFIEGHVPAEDIKRLLAEKSDAKGLVLPGMPKGAPGMERPEMAQPYTVELIARDGTTSVFAEHGQ
jgi:hypothetical protein